MWMIVSVSETVSVIETLVSGRTGVEFYHLINTNTSEPSKLDNDYLRCTMILSAVCGILWGNCTMDKTIDFRHQVASH